MSEEKRLTADEFATNKFKKCKHNKGTFYSPETGIICQGCKQKLIQTWVSKEEKETISFLHESK